MGAGSTDRKEILLKSKGRVGTAFNISGTWEYRYELNDNLGNVRAIIRQGISNLEVMTYTDYYPYGWTLPGRTAGTTYRYGFQGEFAEKDPETGWNAFELRMYDSRIARWSTIDPAGQFHSPYNAFGNNPINGVDPNGGLFFDKWWLFVNKKTGEVTDVQWVSDEGGDEYDIFEVYDNSKGIVQLDALLGKVKVDNPYFYGGDFSRIGPGLWEAGSTPPWQLAPGNLNASDSPIDWLVGAGELKTIFKGGFFLFFIRNYGDDVGKKLLNPAINLTKEGLAHTLDRHTVNNLVQYAGKSKFFDAGEVPDLIRQSTQHPMFIQGNGNYARLVNAGREIGIDRTTGKATSFYSVITRQNGNLVTAFPGKPTGWK